MRQIRAWTVCICVPGLPLSRQVLASVLQRESQKHPTGKGPLAEIEFWRERNAVMSSLYEQLNLPQVGTQVQPIRQMGINMKHSHSCT